jgi:hypothetical protein
VFGDNFDNFFREIAPNELSAAVVEGTNIRYGYSLTRETGSWFLTFDQALKGKLLNNPDSPVTFDRMLPPYVDDPQVTTSPHTLLSHSDSSTGLFAFHGGELSMETGSPVWTRLQVDLANPFNMLQLTLTFQSALGAEGLLSIYINDQYVGVVDERSAGQTIHTYAYSFDQTYGQGVHEFALRLDPYTPVPSRLLVSSIRFGLALTEVPEPSTALQLAGTFALLLVILRTRLSVAPNLH